MNANRIPENDHYYANTKWLLKLRWVAVVGQLVTILECDLAVSACRSRWSLGNGLGDCGHVDLKYRAAALVSPLASASRMIPDDEQKTRPVRRGLILGTSFNSGHACL